MELDMFVIMGSDLGGVEVSCSLCGHDVDLDIGYDWPTIAAVIDKAMKHLSREHAPIFSQTGAGRTPRSVSPSPRADPDRFSRDSHSEQPSPSVTPETDDDAPLRTGGCDSDPICWCCNRRESVIDHPRVAPPASAGGWVPQ